MIFSVPTRTIYASKFINSVIRTQKILQSAPKGTGKKGQKTANVLFS